MSCFHHSNNNKQVIDLTSKCKFGQASENANILIDEDSISHKQYLWIDKFMLTSPIITTEVLNANQNIVHTENHAYIVPSMLSTLRVSRNTLNSMRESLMVF